MNSNSHTLYAVARLRQNEMRLASEEARQLRTAPDPFWEAIIVRLATAQDRDALERLAARTRSRRSGGPTLIAEVHQRPVVALCLSDGTVLADDAVATGNLVALLRLRAQQLRTSGFRWLPGLRPRA